MTTDSIAGAPLRVLKSKARKPRSQPRQRTVFIKILRESANISRAARTAGIPHSTVYSWRNQMPKFRQAWDEALRGALDDLEEVLRDRAINGVEKPYFYKGEISGYIRTHSDALGMFVLRRHRPGVYGDRAAENEGTGAVSSISAQLDKIAEQVKERERSVVIEGEIAAPSP